MAKKISANLSSDQSIVVSRFQIDPANFTLSSLPDTSITSPVNGNFLSYYNNNWVNVDAPTARTNLGLGSLATLNSLAFADLTTTPTTIAGYGITDAVTSVDGSTGAVTTLQLGTSPTTALAGDTVIPDVSDFITASSTEILTNKSIDATQLTDTIDNERLPAAATNITSLGSLTGLTIDSLGTPAVPIPTVVTFDNQFGTTTLDVKSSASQWAANQKATIKVSARSRAAVEFRSRNFGNANYDLFFGHVASVGGETQDYALLRAPTSKFIIKSDDDEVELNGTTVLLNTPTVEFKGSGYSSDLTSSIKPDNTNSSSSWKLTDKVLNINSASSLPTAMWLGDSGTKLYVIGSSNDDIDRFELTTPYDISSNIIATTSNDDGNGSVPQGMYFKSDGSRYWTVDSGPDYIRQYSLSTAWDIQTSSRSTNAANGKSYVDIRLNGGANPTGVAFSADGLKVIICGTNGAGSTGDSIYSYTLDTAFDIFTMVGMDTNNVAPSPDVRVQFSSFTDLRDEISIPHDIFFLPDGLTLYVVCRDRDDIVTFTLGTAFDITTMTYNGHLSIDDIDGTVGALYVDPVNNIGLMVGQINDSVYQWTVDNNALIVDAQSTQFKGQLGVYDDLTVDGDVKISGKSFYKGALISSGNTTIFGNTILGNTTGVYTRIGHTSGTATLDFGRSIKSQIINLHGGVTESGETKTLNIGTGGDSGSTTNITIGTATAGATQTTTVNGTLTVSSGITGSQTLAATTDTSIDAAEFATYAGKKIVYTGGAGTIILADAVADDVGKSWVILNSGTGAITIDRATSSQTIKHLNGSAVSAGSVDLTVAIGAVTEIICTAADNYIIFGSGIS